MAIEFIVDSLDKVEESIRGAYEEVDGKFHFNADKYADIKAQGLKTKNKELLTKITSQKDAVTRAEKFKDVDDDEFEEFATWKQNRDNPQPDKDKKPETSVTKEYHERTLKKERDASAKTIKELTDTNAALTKKDREHSIWNPVKEAMLKAGILPERHAALEKILRHDGRFDLDENGKVIFKDSDGDATDLSIDKAFESKLVDEFAWAFKARSGGGSGGQNNTTAASGVQTIKFGDQEAINNNIEGIASGKVAVVD